MALYLYQCVPCDLGFEVDHPITQPKGADCPKCKERTEVRLIAGSSFVLKGDGWAKDLYSSAKKDQ
jgi:putative FmdB family regulatory protein